MARHNYINGVDATQVIERPGRDMDSLPFWRRFSVVGVSFVLLLATIGLVLWWVRRLVEVGPSRSGSAWGAIINLVFILVAGLFFSALFKDVHEKRHRQTERRVRDLLFYKHDETREALQGMLNETVRRLEGVADQAAANLDATRRRNMAAYVAMHQQTLDMVGVVVDAKMERVMAEHSHILEGLLLLEKVMPELLAQTEWVAYAKGIRAGLENDVPIGPDAPVRFPQSQPTRRRPGAQLRSVPESSSN